MVDRTYVLQEPWLALALLVGVVLAGALGMLLGRRRKRRVDPNAGSELDTIIAAVLGMFALVLGFTLSMAVSRYDARKVATVEEANAIETTYLRAGFLSPSRRDEVRAQLTEYLDADVQFYQLLDQPAALRRVDARLQALQGRLWAAAEAEGNADPRAITTGLFTQSLNALIDTHALRLEWFRNYLPPTLLTLICVFAFISSALTGYATGFYAREDRIPAAISALMAVCVVVVVFDIDRPLQGLIQVGQKSMLDAQDFIRAHGGPVTSR